MRKPQLALYRGLLSVFLAVLLSSLLLFVGGLPSGEDDTIYTAGLIEDTTTAYHPSLPGVVTTRFITTAPTAVTAEDTAQPIETAEVVETPLPTDAPETTAPIVTTTAAPAPPVTTTAPSGPSPGHLFAFWGFEYDDTDEVLSSRLLALDTLAAEYAGTLTFYYENLSTGAAIAYNASQPYTSASVVKAPYVKALLAGGVNLTDVAPLTEDLHWGGQVFTKDSLLAVGDLIYLTIVYSDNVAYNSLVAKYGAEPFNALSTALGQTAALPPDNNFCDMTAMQGAAFFKDIYRYIQGSGPNSGKLLSYLQTCDYNRQIGKALPQYPVAQKYGANFTRQSFHDAAIVYAPSPYVLSVFTGLDPVEGNTEVFIRLAQIIDGINSRVTAKPRQVIRTD